MENEKARATNFINISVLDVRKAAERDLGRVKMVNVGYVLYTPKTFEMIRGGKRVNVGQLVEASPEARVLLSPTVFTNETFQQQEAPLEMMAFGPVTVDWTTTPEAIKEGLKRLDIFGGPLICPKHLVGGLGAKIQHQNGETVVYENPQARFVMGKLKLDEAYLDSLEDGAELVVVGSLKVPEVLPAGQIEQKIKRLFVRGGVVCHEENAAALQAVMDGARHKVKVIPAGYTLVEKPLLLNQLALESLRCHRIYCTEWVQIDASVKAETLDQQLESLVAEERVFCPVSLQDVIGAKCDWLKTSIQLYEGELWVIEDERQLPAYAFDRLEDRATLLNFGELTLNEQITPETLMERIDKVHNLGLIRCTPAQMGAVQALLGVSEGHMADSMAPKKQEAPEPEGDLIEETYVNANYVSL